MLRIMQSGAVTVLLGTLSYLGVTVAVMNPAKIFTGKQLQGASHQGRVVGASWQFFDPEVDRLVEELAQAREKLAEREREIAEYAQRLETERAEITQITQIVFQAQQAFDRNVIRVQQEEAANLKRLAKMYAAMTPDGAATILGALDDEQIVRVLFFMKEAETAAILELMSKKGEAETKRVALLSERLRTSLARNAP